METVPSKTKKNINAEMLISQASEAIEHREYGKSRRWLIVWLDDKIQCVTPDCSRKPEAIFEVYSQYQLVLGLTSLQWDCLGKKIQVFLESRG